MGSTKKQLIKLAYSVKKRFLAMYWRAKAGHIGCSLSCAEILVFIKFAWMDQHDQLILSKGHAAAALYSVLAEAGMLSEDKILTFYQNATYLAAHPPAGKIPGIPFATGSLGHGLALCGGMALGARLKNKNKNFFCVTSDGELDEGSVWETALFLPQHKLKNVIWFIDRNQIQGIGKTEDVMALEPLDAKLKSFGFFVIEADGHDFDSLFSARQKCLEDFVHERPKVIICKTIKGHGVSFMENTVDCHYLPMNQEQYEKAVAELDTYYQQFEGILS